MSDETEVATDNEAAAADADIQKAAFQDLHNSGDGNTESNLDVILDIPVTISMEIGRTEIPIHNLL